MTGLPLNFFYGDTPIKVTIIFSSDVTMEGADMAKDLRQVTLLRLSDWHEKVVNVLVVDGVAPQLLVMLGQSGNHAYCKDTGQQYKQTDRCYVPTKRIISVDTIQSAYNINKPVAPTIYSWE